MNGELLTFVKISNNGLQRNKLLQEQNRKINKIKGVLSTILVMAVTFAVMLLPGIVENLF